MTERLQKCIDAGDALSLFPLLSKWPKEELQALLDDVDSFCKDAEHSIEEVHKKEAFKTENFFSRERSQQLDKAREQASLNLMAICSEVASVALYYLGEG